MCILFIGWICHTDCMCIVWVCEFGKLSYVAFLISIDIIILNYLVLFMSLYCDFEPLWYNLTIYILMWTQSVIATR